MLFQKPVSNRSLKLKDTPLEKPIERVGLTLPPEYTEREYDKERLIERKPKTIKTNVDQANTFSKLENEIIEFKKKKQAEREFIERNYSRYQKKRKRVRLKPEQAIAANITSAFNRDDTARFLEDEKGFIQIKFG